MARVHPYFLFQIALSVLVCVVLAASARAGEQASRIVSLGGGVTEIVHALSQQDRLVARDTTSNYPEAVLDLTDVGYIRAISAEGVLSVSPDLILAKEGAGPVESVELLEAASLPITWVPEGFTKEAVTRKITVVADALGVPERGDALAREVRAEIESAVRAAETPQKRRVLFILSMAGGRIMAAGTNTSPDGLISLAGGENAASGFEGFKPITDEAILTSQPDVILAMTRVGEQVMTDAQILAHPAIKATPAGQGKAIVRMDGMLLTGFSVRTGQAIAELADNLKSAGS